MNAVLDLLRPYVGLSVQITRFLPYETTVNGVPETVHVVRFGNVLLVSREAFEALQKLPEGAA